MVLKISKKKICWFTYAFIYLFIYFVIDIESSSERIHLTSICRRGLINLKEKKKTKDAEIWLLMLPINYIKVVAIDL